jgi:hypothetical protein
MPELYAQRSPDPNLPTVHREEFNWLRVFPGRQVCLKAAAKLDFQLRSPDRVESSFLEGWNGWKPSWASDSHTIGSRVV